LEYIISKTFCELKFILLLYFEYYAHDQLQYFYISNALFAIGELHGGVILIPWFREQKTVSSLSYTYLTDPSVTLFMHSCLLHIQMVSFARLVLLMLCLSPVLWPLLLPSHCS